MKRLTFDGNFCDIAKCADVCEGMICEDDACSQRKTWERLKAIEDILGNEYDLDRLRELVQADSEGRCAVLPLVEREYVDKFLDDLKDVFSEWGYEDASVGLFGMNESEKQLAEAIIAALEKEENRNG